MPYSYFTSGQLIPLIISAIFLLASILLFRRNQNAGLWMLFLGALGMGYFMANLDPFLNLWDEQYHALVAKNLAKNPFMPLLYAESLLDYSHKGWTANHIWLHKQPLFLWQMAMSIKLFGVNELAVRFPSVLMHALIPLFIYRIGKITVNKETGFYGALLFAVAHFPLELVAGRYTTDHNDMAFLFYVTASFWAWFEYEHSGKKYWLILIGLFSGCAVLVKWLMGLLVFVIWFLTNITTSRSKLRIRSYLPMFIAFGISLLTFLPWQYYIFSTFPLEAKYEHLLNSKHLLIPIEGHAESQWYYFTDGLGKLYGSGIAIPFLIIIGLVLLMKRIKVNQYKAFIIASIVFVYGFFTVAATKMTAFPLIVAPFIYLGLALIIDILTTFIENKMNRKPLGILISATILLATTFTTLNLSRIQNKHTFWKPHDNDRRSEDLSEMEFIWSLDVSLGHEKHVIFNVNITHNGHIPVMFYTNHIAYGFIPEESQIKQIKEQEIDIAIVDSGDLPKYIKTDDSIIKLSPK